jgi:hypothetical protein
LNKYKYNWIITYKRNGIIITTTSKDIQRALKEFGYEDEDNRGVAIPSHIYFPKAFLDMIVKWIIADD